MKFKLIGVLAFALIAGSATAQHNNFGIKGGLNYYTLIGDNTSGVDSKLGAHFGIISHIHLANQWALQPELIFSMQGAEFGNAKLNLNYVNVPLLFQYMFDNGFRIQAGPQVGFLLSAKLEDEDVKDLFKTIDFGAAVGASYVHTPSGFGVDLRYNIGLSNINDGGPGDTQNKGIQFGVFYLFGHKS
jgi:hypothetical protein